jgi:hypothetical protein
MSQEEVGALVRSSMEKAKSIPPSPKSASAAAGLSPRPHNPYTATSQRLTRTPKRGARKFHFRLSPEAKKSNETKQNAFASESTTPASMSRSKESAIESRSETASPRSNNDADRCPSPEIVTTDGEVKPAVDDNVEEPILDDPDDSKLLLSKDDSVEERPTKKNLSEAEIGDLVRNSIRRARESAKEKPPQQQPLSNAEQQPTAFVINEITTSPRGKQDLSWTSTDDREPVVDHYIGDIICQSMQELKVVMTENESQSIVEAKEAKEAKETKEAKEAKIAPVVTSIPDIDDVAMPLSPTNEPSVVSEARTQISRAFRSFFHGTFEPAAIDTTSNSHAPKNTQGIDGLHQDRLRVDIPSFSEEEARDEKPSLNRIVQETMRRAKETAEGEVEKVLECATRTDVMSLRVLECVTRTDVLPVRALADSYASTVRCEESTSSLLQMPNKDTKYLREDHGCGGSTDVQSDPAIQIGEEDSDEKRMIDAMDISDVDSLIEDIEDVSYQRSVHTNFGPFAGCCGVENVLSDPEPKQGVDDDTDDMDVYECDAVTKNSCKETPIDTAEAAMIEAIASIDPLEVDQQTSPQRGPTLEEVMMQLLKSETDAETTGLGHSQAEPTPIELKESEKSFEAVQAKGSRPLLKLKVSVSSDDEYPTAKEVRKSLSASLQSGSTANRTRSASDYSGTRRAQTLSNQNRTRRYRRSRSLRPYARDHHQSPKAEITDEFLADLSKRKGTHITIDELKRMLKVKDIASEEEEQVNVTTSGQVEDDDRTSNYTPLHLQPLVPGATTLSNTPFCMDIWELFQPIDDLQQLSDDDIARLESYHSTADQEESAAEDTTSVETTTFCETDADAQPNPRMTFSFSAREGSSSSDDSTVIGW